MTNTSVKGQALADLDLLDSVVAFKQRFYPRGWARYDLAKPGTLVLVPKDHVLASVRSDYRSMRSIIFADVPELEDIQSRLQSLQQEINA